MRRPERKTSIDIGLPRLEQANGTVRVTADVDGMDVWFETADLPLSPVPEAFGSAFLLPALERHAVLRLEGRADRFWVSNSTPLVNLVHEWWGLPKKYPRVNARPPQASDGQAGENGLFFSAGGDCFHSLICGGHRIDRLVLIQGYDYGLSDARRHEPTELALREVAAAKGMAATLIRTNVRTHPLFEGVSWEVAHGGVLMGIGHVLGDSVRRMYVASSRSFDSGLPWGSHWRLDPLWSSSRREFVPTGMEARKGAKLQGIARDPLAQRHLRVCWENRLPQGNCSRCLKCMYTRVVLAEVGQLQHFETLDGAETLAADFDRLPRAEVRLRTYRELMHSPALDADVKGAIGRLVARTERDMRFPVRVRRALVRKLVEWS